MHPRNIKPILVYSFFALLLFSGIFICAIERERYFQARERVSYIATAQSEKIQHVLNGLLQKTETMEMLILQGGGEIGQFDKVAGRLTEDCAIESLDVAPGGVPQYRFSKNPKRRVALDAFSWPIRIKEALTSYVKGTLTISSTFALPQGGMGIAAYRPIYMDTEDGERFYWGSTSIVLKLPEALEAADFKNLQKEGYAYKLQRIDSVTNDIQVIMESSSERLIRPVNISFALSNTQWVISVAPIGGWYDSNATLLETVLTILVIVLAELLEYTVLSLQVQKKRLEDLSVTDVLTGLFNRRKMEEILNKKCANTRQPFLLCFMDLNYFKMINDSFGHDCGDQFLKECARRFKNVLDEDDMLFRIGGDEFVAILCGRNNRREYEKVCKKLEECISKRPFKLDGSMVSASVSIGGALFPDDAMDAEKMLQLADNAMYRFKGKHKHSALTIE